MGDNIIEMFKQVAIPPIPEYIMVVTEPIVTSVA